jgi:heme A synthase
VGAGLVLFRLVADNASMARALFMAVHLVNTFILIAWLTLTAWWLSGGAPVRFARRGTAALVGALAVGLLATGMSGAVAALGDTLFPAGSLRESLAADLSATSHVLVRLRVLHPAIAIATGLALALAAVRLPMPGDQSGLRLARLLAALVTVQLAAGLVNVILLAPVWLQMVHLLLADAVWIAFVLLGARALAAPSASAAVTEAA